MPSPLGHALAGAAAGWAIAASSRRSTVSGLWRSGLVFAALGMLPDADLLVGAHSGPTHGLGAALIVGLCAAVLTRRAWMAIAAGAAYASHTLLDWLGSDSSPPIGIMALWPFSRAYYESRLHLFEAISRRYWLPGFFEHNVKAVGRELIVLAGPALLSAWMMRRTRQRTAAGEGQ